MPEAIRGAWRLDDLGRGPTREDCETTAPNIGKVLKVSANGFSIFEECGRILQVHARTGETIEATFDTTYADTPTRARKRFALKAGPSLAVLDSEEGGALSYSPCPPDPA